MACSWMFSVILIISNLCLFHAPITCGISVNNLYLENSHDTEEKIASLTQRKRERKPKISFRSDDLALEREGQALEFTNWGGRLLLQEQEKWVLKCPARYNGSTKVAWWRNGIPLERKLELKPPGFWCGDPVLEVKGEDLFMSHVTSQLVTANFSCHAAGNTSEIWAFEIHVMGMEDGCSLPPARLALFLLPIFALITAIIFLCWLAQRHVPRAISVWPRHSPAPPSSHRATLRVSTSPYLESTSRARLVAEKPMLMELKPHPTAPDEPQFAVIHVSGHVSHEHQYTEGVEEEKKKNTMMVDRVNFRGPVTICIFPQSEELQEANVAGEDIAGSALDLQQQQQEEAGSLVVRLHESRTTNQRREQQSGEQVEQLLTASPAVPVETLSCEL